MQKNFYSTQWDFDVSAFKIFDQNKNLIQLLKRKKKHMLLIKLYALKFDIFSASFGWN